ncbi:unnamed protein product [Phyllotreta striolata]|uniref:Uncharacterized protein n=1 Tax=Phyllotreta striolata TaxID=444603 RepID=A0A9N9XQ58_PHYSR|nr:unnamed protein product [Phyllotreta striolata]
MTSIVGKKKKLLLNYVEIDMAWKNFVESDWKVVKNYDYRWSFIKTEYKALQEKLHELTANSQMLKRIQGEPEIDRRELGRYPLSSNHLYGYVANNPQMRLEKWGPDVYKPIPLPTIYKLIK